MSVLHAVVTIIITNITVLQHFHPPPPATPTRSPTRLPELGAFWVGPAGAGSLAPLPYFPEAVTAFTAQVFFFLFFSFFIYFFMGITL